MLAWRQRPSLPPPGHAVDVFEASRLAGGRARATQLGDLTVDNGQHILVGAYAETLRLMRAVGVDPDHVLRRTPLALRVPRRISDAGAKAAGALAHRIRPAAGPRPRLARKARGDTADARPAGECLPRGARPQRHALAG
jgi:phytoene dehydrogenase-like protein